MKGVPKSIPNRERHVHPGGGRLVRQAGGVVQKDFVITRMNQQRRQAVQVGI